MEKERGIWGWIKGHTQEMEVGKFRVPLGQESREWRSGLNVGVGVCALPRLARAWKRDGILNLLRKQVSTKVSV